MALSKNSVKALSTAAVAAVVGISSYYYLGNSYVTSTPVGTIEGTFSVNPNGSANYSIPIEVPPGTNGVDPDLAISYSSQGQNGYLGQGFGLSGISAISRCSYIKNYDQANFQRIGVTFTATDHFCLDGDELIVTNGGTYGADGTQYRTSKENWTKVISNGACGSGPCSFTAYNKDGAILNFGGTSDSKIVAQGRSDGLVKTWSINQFTDLNGNYTQVVYVNNQSNGEYYPSRINYTGNTRTGQQPQRSVSFEYEDRNDVITGYIIGSLSTVSKRLSAVKTYVGSSLVLSYNLNYNYSPTTGRSILHEIENCDSQGVCLPETTFLTAQDQQVAQPVSLDLITLITNGVGSQTKINYSFLSLGADYTQGSSAIYPVQDIQSAMEVVSSYSVCDGSINCDGVTPSGHQYIYSYDYSGAEYDVQRALWLGFRTFKTIDAANNRYTIATYSQNYPYNGLLVSSEVCSMGKVAGSANCSDGAGSLMSQTSTTYTDISAPSTQALGINQVVPSLTSFAIYTLGQSSPSSKVAKTFSYDAFGNTTLVADLGDVDANNNPIANPDNYPLYSCSIYSNDETNWRLGYVIQDKQDKNLQGCQNFLSSATNPANISWSSSNDLTWTKTAYDSNMNVISKSIYDDSNNIFLTTYSKYDSYGNIIGSIAASGTPSSDPGASCISNPTQTCITYDSTYNSFPVQIQSPANSQGVRLSNWKSFEPAFGQLVYDTNPNGSSAGDEAFTLFYEMDGFGRLINTYGPDQSGDKILLSTNQFFSTSPSGSYTKTLSMNDWDNNDQTTWYWQESYVDGMDREYRKRQKGLNDGADDAIVTSTNFSAQGNVDGETSPYFQSTNPTNALPQDWAMTCGTQATSYTAANNLNWEKINYNIYNRPTCNTSPDAVQKRTAYQYQPSGNLNLLNTTKTDAYNTSDSVAESTFQNSNQAIVKRTYPNGNVLYYKYDQLGNLIAQTLNNPYNSNSCASPVDKGTTCFTYDSVGRKRSQTSADSGTESYSYDAHGRLTLVTNANNNTVAYTAYDNLDRLLSKTSSYVDYAGVTHSQTDNYTYDSYAGSVNSKGNLAYLEGIDGTGASIYSYNISYDAYGHVASNVTTIPSLSSHSLVYSKSYDPMGRISFYTYPDGSVQKVTYAADNNVGNVALCDTGSQSDCSGDAHFETYATYNNYTAFGQIISANYSNRQGQNIININKEYYPGQGAKSASGQFIGDSYGLKSLTATSTNQANANLFSKEYKWNQLNQIFNIVDLVHPPIGNQTYSYNDQPSNVDMGYLTGAQGNYGNNNYNYDSVGNIQMQKTSNPPATVNYSYYNDTNKISSSTPNSVSYDYYANGNLKQKTQSPTSWNFSYDSVGNLVQSNKVASGNNVSEYYVYDGFGVNISKRVTSAQGTNSTYYIAPGYEIDNLGSSIIHTKYISGPDGVVAAITSNGSGVEGIALAAFNHDTKIAQLLGAHSDFASQAKSVFHHFSAMVNHPGTFKWLGSATLLIIAFTLISMLCWLVFAARFNNGFYQAGFALAHPLKTFAIPFSIFFLLISNISIANAALIPGTNGAGYPTAGMTRFFVKDHLNSVVAVTDENGLQTANVEYLPYGAIDQVNSSGTDDFRPKFISKEWDNNDSLYNFGDRFYDPNLGRFTTPDPSSQYLSPYLYTGDNPISYIDEDGDFAFIIIAAIIIGALAGAYAGGMAVNGGNPNPAAWDWNDGMTYAGIFGGAAIGGISGAAGAYVGLTYGVAAGTTAAVVLGGGENAAFAAMGGGSAKDIGIAAGEGAAFGLAFELGGAAIGSVASKFARQGTSQAAKVAAKSLDNNVDDAALTARKATSNSCASFVAGTKVVTDKGMKSIETIQVGDLVLSHDKKSKADEFNKVLNLKNRTSPNIIKIILEDERTIKSTDNHPYYTKRGENYKWVEAKDLKVGDQLHSTKAPSKIAKIEKLAGDKVFNFEVENNHNYYVSDSEILVHNAKCSLKYSPKWTKAQKAEADLKVAKMNSYAKKNAGGLTVNKSPNTRGKIASFRKANATKPGNFAAGKVRGGVDVDHVIELQLSPSPGDVHTNMWFLDSSVNRSVGSQINHWGKANPGQKITGFSIA